MKVLFLARATLYSVFGGDTLQIKSTAKYLERLGVSVDIKLANEEIEYHNYDLLHVFNVIRPGDMLSHVKKSGLPYVLSTIFVDYSEYQQKHATGVVALMNKLLTADQLEYIKAIARWLKNGEAINSREYLYIGHKRAVQKLAGGAAWFLPNSEGEYRRFVASYGVERPYRVIPNGVDLEIFKRADDGVIGKNDCKSVLCVSRIEGKKNHLNLIKALNNTDFDLTIIGKPAPNHVKYYEECKKIACSNIKFLDFLPQEQLIEQYKAAKVHVLPSWNETCGLSSLESAYYNCNLVITDKGDTRDYFGKNAWYCDPGSPRSIYEAIVNASETPPDNALQKQIISTFNWEQAAARTLSVYELVANK